MTLFATEVCKSVTVASQVCGCEYLLIMSLSHFWSMAEGRRDENEKKEMQDLEEHYLENV